MKYRSIKKKITILYTGCIAIVLLIVLAGMLFYIKNIETNAAEEELQGKSDAFYGRIQIQGEAFTIRLIWNFTMTESSYPFMTMMVRRWQAAFRVIFRFKQS